MGGLDALFHGQGVAAPCNIQQSEPLRFGFRASQDIRKQARQIFYVKELLPLLQIFVAEGKGVAEALSFIAQALGAFSVSLWRAAKSVNQIVVHASSCDELRPQHK